MKLLTSNRYYALNDRTINLLMKCDIGLSAVAGEDFIVSVNDAEFRIYLLMKQMLNPL